MKTNIKELVEFLNSHEVIVDYHEANNKYSFSFYGDLYSHKDGYLQNVCTISTTNVDIALELIQLDVRVSKISDISMTRFNIVSDSIKFDYDIKEIEVEISTQFVK